MQHKALHNIQKHEAEIQNAKLDPLHLNTRATPPPPYPSTLTHTAETVSGITWQGTEEPQEETTTYGDIMHTERGLQDPG